MSKYFYTDGGKKFGPFSKEELRNKNISRETKIWFNGMDNWTELSKISELSDVLNSIPPEIKSIPTNKNCNAKNVSVSTKETNQEQVVSISPPKQKKKLSTLYKGLIVLFLIFIVSLFIISHIQNRSDLNFYNEVVANSYDSDEDFDTYVQKFYRDLAFHGIYPQKPKVTIIKFSKLDELKNTTHIHAMSFGINNDDIIEIYINPSSWNQFNKPMRYLLMYHELAHDVLNLYDLDAKKSNEGKLMYPEISSYENINMDDFIDSAHALFEVY